VAVIGMAGRFAAAGSVRELWEALCAGRDLVRTLSDEELRGLGLEPSRLDLRRFVRRGAVLAGIDRFAASFFGLSRREAELMDPQHRLFLECAWEALEDAAHDAQRFDGRIGVFAGANWNTYGVRLLTRPEVAAGAGWAQADVYSRPDFLSTRVSYELDLRGPSVTVQTSCSTSLVAVHLACQSLLGGECDMALAGGVSIQVPQAGYSHDIDGIASPDGRCRSYDASGRGIVPGNGLGVVVLRRLAEALAAGDHVEAVIVGSAVNNDGAGKVGFTAPSVEGQVEVISEALALAGVEPETIGYVEGHGTGTVLGDPIEVQALREVFGSGGGDRCALGSVKSNIGHADAAAGVAGLIKAVLAVREGRIPPSLHFERANPACELDRSPFYVPVETREWREPGPRRAAVSSFGIGGTNAHVVLEQAPHAQTETSQRPVLLLVQSARTRPALERYGSELALALETGEPDLSDVAWTLQVGRRQLEHRRALVVRTPAAAAAGLRGGVGTWGRAHRARDVVFLFPGQGAQHAAMGRGLYEHEPEYRRLVDRCCARLEAPLGLDLRQRLYPAPGREELAEQELEQTRLAQPALFVTAYAAAMTLLSWGVRPAAMVGHSLGELVAACLAGVMDLDDALWLVAERGRLMQEMPPGAMLAIAAGEEEARRVVPGGVDLAAVNAPDRVVASGPAPAIERLRTELEREGVRCQRLRTSHAFHSAMLDPVVGELEAAARTVELGPPRLPYVSNVSGDWAGPEAADPRYWGRQLRDPVRFWRGVETVLDRWEDAILLEVGAGTSLTGLVTGRRPGVDAVATMGHREDPRGGEEVLHEALGRLWTLGVQVDWAAYWGGARRRLSLPTYPFERERYWIGDEAAPGCDPAPAPAAPPEPAAPAEPEDPEDAVAAEVLAAWRLTVGGDGRESDFFEQGGNSLIAAQLVNQLADALDVDLSVRAVFEHPTPAGLTEAVRAALAAAGDQARC
jgi:acyl transferase domain-containing protein